MRETVTLCREMSELVYNMFEGLPFQNKHHIRNASFSSRTNACVFFKICAETPFGSSSITEKEFVV